MPFFENACITRIRNCSKVTLTAGRNISFKPRRLHSFVFFVSGKVLYKYPDDNSFYCESATPFVYMPKGVPYEVYPIEDTCLLVVNFDAALTAAPTTGFSTDYQNISRIKDCMYSMVNAYMQQRIGARAEVFSLLYKTIFWIQRNDLSDYLPANRINKLEPALRYIDEHLLDPEIRVSQLVSLCGISEKYFTTLFTFFYKVSAKQYILNKKLEYAKTCLILTGDSISEISEKCGFSSLYYFSKLFKQRTGMTPTEYRNIQQF